MKDDSIFKGLPDDIFDFEKMNLDSVDLKDPFNTLPSKVFDSEWERCANEAPEEHRKERDAMYGKHPETKKGHRHFFDRMMRDVMNSISASQGADMSAKAMDKMKETIGKGADLAYAKSLESTRTKFQQAISTETRKVWMWRPDRDAISGERIPKKDVNFKKLLEAEMYEFTSFGDKKTYSIGYGDFTNAGGNQAINDVATKTFKHIPWMCQNMPKKNVVYDYGLFVLLCYDENGEPCDVDFASPKEFIDCANQFLKV